MKYFNEIINCYLPFISIDIYIMNLVEQTFILVQINYKFLLENKTTFQ